MGVRQFNQVSVIGVKPYLWSTCIWVLFDDLLSPDGFCFTYDCCSSCETLFHFICWSLRAKCTDQLSDWSWLPIALSSREKDALPGAGCSGVVFDVWFIIDLLFIIIFDMNLGFEEHRKKESDHFGHLHNWSPVDICTQKNYNICICGPNSQD